MTEKVLIYDYTADGYWRKDSNGYSRCIYEAGLYKEEKAISIIIGLTERKMEMQPVPVDHPEVLKLKIIKLELRIIELEMLCKLYGLPIPISMYNEFNSTSSEEPPQFS